MVLVLVALVITLVVGVVFARQLERWVPNPVNRLAVGLLGAAIVVLGIALAPPAGA